MGWPERPSVLGRCPVPELTSFAEVALLLVGIKLDVKLIRSLGVVSVMTGLGQVTFTAFFGSKAPR